MLEPPTLHILKGEGTGEMAPWMWGGVLVALGENQGLIPSTYRMAHKHLHLQFQESRPDFQLIPGAGKHS